MLKPVNRRNTDSQRMGGSLKTLSRPAPINGINARDAEDAMDELDAIRMINMIPDSNKVVTRPGTGAHSTGNGTAEVETLAVWFGLTDQKLIAGGDGGLWDASDAGAATQIVAASTYTEDEWQTCMHKHRLFGFNGTDAPFDYDGSSLVSTAWTGTGLTKANLIQAVSHAGRLYIVEKDQADFWYSGVGAVTGTLTQFSLSQFTLKGGHLKAIGVWSRDGGAGSEDLLVFVFSTGEIIVYQGYNPANAGTFAKVGNFVGAPPIGRQCIKEIGGDLVVLTQAGPLPVSLIMQGATADQIQKSTMWGKISRKFQDSAALYSNVPGWSIGEVLPNGRMYFIVAEVLATSYRMYVLNTNRGAWGELQGFDGGRHFVCFEDKVYFASSAGKVQIHEGNTDVGASITFNAKGAFTYLGNRESTKLWTAVRSVFKGKGTQRLTVALDIDFTDLGFGSGLQSYETPSDGSSWDTENWDDATWASEGQPVLQWVSAGGQGRAGAVRFFGGTDETIEWYSSDYMVKIGGGL